MERICDHATLDLPLPRLSRVASRGMAYLTDEALYSTVGVRLAFTERAGGVSVAPYAGLDLATHVGDDPVAVAANRHLALEALGLLGSEDVLANPKQVHSSIVRVLDAPGVGLERIGEGCDGIVCTAEDLPVLLCFADCLPLVLVASNGDFAVVHCGWRGTIARIASKACGMLAEASGCDPAGFDAYIGPHIGACCYETSPQILERFVQAFGATCDAGSQHLSLSEAVRADLATCGMKPDRIVDADLCTAEHTDRFFSYRAQNGVCGRHGAIVCRQASGGFR